MSVTRSVSKPSNLHILPLTAIFFVTAMIMYLLGIFYAIGIIPNLVVQENVRSPLGWMLTHIFLLGWVSMLAMGASFQLVQVILNTKLYSRFLGYVNYGFYTTGLILLILAFHSGNSKQIAIGGIFVSTGVFLYVFNMGKTLILQRKWNVFVLGMALSLFNFLLTVLFGVMMGISSGSGWASNHYEQIFETHLWIGVGGWISCLILVFSLKLLPMFHISRRKVGADGYWIIGLLHLGVWLQVSAIWLRIDPIGYLAILFILAALSLFIHFIHQVEQRGKPPGGTVSIAALIIPPVFVMFIIWIFADYVYKGSTFDRNVTIGFVYFLILGWFSATIFSYLSKIIPFLWWAYRFHTKWQKKNLVQLSNMTPDKHMKVELLLYLAGIGAVSAAFVWQCPALALIGQIAAAVFAAVYIIELIRILRY